MQIPHLNSLNMCFSSSLIFKVDLKEEKETEETRVNRKTQATISGESAMYQETRHIELS